MTSDPHNLSAPTHPAPAAGLLPLATLVIWLLCLTIGLLGLRLPYPHPLATTDQPPTQAQLLTVEVPKSPPLPTIPPPPPELGTPSPERTSPAPAPPQPSPLPDAPAITPVVAPSPAISFALPVEGLTRIVDINDAAHARSGQGTLTGNPSGTGLPGSTGTAPSGSQSAQPFVSRLTFGQGEGRQPPPEYPRIAILDRQEGTVTLRITVAEDGRVASAEITSPCPYAILNQSALRAVRDTWHFNPGPRRIYEVPIQFQITK